MNHKLVKMIEDAGLEVSDVANIIRAAQGEAVMTFVNNMVGAFESGFIDDHESTLADLYSCAVNHVKDNYDRSVPTLKESWGEKLAELCRVGDADYPKENNEVTIEKAAEQLRVAIQVAEEFGLVRTLDGSVITGALSSEHGVMLVKE